MNYPRHIVPVYYINIIVYNVIYNDMMCFPNSQNINDFSQNIEQNLLRNEELLFENYNHSFE